ncbi:VirB4 family type IV secretion system protein [Ruminococcus albus]|uniref:VirB4 family type IV secretion system protein n=1 Tax=Ruminococcus albus TaxID=1264 RepID=UPI0004639DDF|nr:DUF87 domain-containing protein [Ruminococcus albus]
MKSLREIKIKNINKTKKVRVTSAMFLDNLIDLNSFSVPNEEFIFKIKADGKDKYISLLMVSGIDIFHYTDNDMESVFQNFARATTSMKCAHKYIFTTSSPYFEQQKNNLLLKRRNITHKYIMRMMARKENEFLEFEENHSDRLAYLLIFSDDISELDDCCKRFKREMIDTNVLFCNEEQTIEFFNKYLCFDTQSDKLHTYTETNDKTLPTEIKFYQNYFKIEDKYITSLVVNDYPANLNDLELAALVSTFADCTITFDVKFRSKQIVIDEIKQSLKELRSRAVIKQDVADDIDTQNEFDKLTAIYNEISSGNEQMVYTTLRFFVTSDSYEELSKRVRDISVELETRGITSFVPINDLKSEYFGMTTDSNTIQTPYPLQDTYKRQYPFYYQSHTDPSGIFFGYTDTHGLNIFNCFYRNDKQGRNSYDLLAVGVKGSGKSVTLKTMLQDQLLLGNKVMVLDIENEYRDMARIFDGQVIRMSRGNTINPLQIRMTVLADAENDDENDGASITKSEAISMNFTLEISRICSFFGQYNPSLSDDELFALRDVLVAVYKEKGITDTTDISSFLPEQFPIFSDLYNYLTNIQKDQTLSEYERSNYKKLETQIKQLSKYGAFGTMFDNYTNVNIDDKNLIVFDVKQISEMETNVYNAQLFNILSLMWAETCKNREHNAFVSPHERRYIVCLLDEAHRFISVKNRQVTKFIETLLRRSRKYDAGLWFASQSILDFLPSSDSAETDVIKTIFQLIQYKIILKQSPDSIQKLHEIFSQFTLSELNNSTNFQAGEMLMSLSAGRNKVHCYKIATDCDLMYIGNAQDRSEIIHKIFNRYYTEMSMKEYGKQLLNDPAIRENFCKVFTNEVLSIFGFEKEDSDYLYTLVASTVISFGQELIDIAKE